MRIGEVFKYGLLTMMVLLCCPGYQTNGQDKSISAVRDRTLNLPGFTGNSAFSQVQVLPSNEQGGVSLLGWSVFLFENRAHIGAHQADSSGGLKGLSYVLDYDGLSWNQSDALTPDEEWRRQGHANSLDTLNMRSFWGFPFDILSVGGTVRVNSFGDMYTEISQDLYASDGMAGDQFGWSVSLSGDRALVGAPEDDGLGSVYVFEYDGSSWAEVHRLSAADGVSGDQFGWSVSLLGDRALIGAPGFDANRGAVYVFEYDGASWTQALKLTGSESPLPVELTSFLAVASSASIYLSWATSSELNNAGFVVELRTADRDFAQVGFVKGGGTTTLPQQYEFILNDVASNSYTLRLKQIDFDGTFSYSETIDLVVEAADYHLAQSYPNPFNPQATIEYELPVGSRVRLEVFDLLGRSVLLMVDEEQALVL